MSGHLCCYVKTQPQYKKCVVQTACGRVYMAVKDSYTVAELQGLKK